MGRLLKGIEEDWRTSRLFAVQQGYNWDYRISFKSELRSYTQLWDVGEVVLP